VKLQTSYPAIAVSCILFVPLILQNSMVYHRPVKAAILAALLVAVHAPEWRRFIAPVTVFLSMADVAEYAVNPMGHDYQVYSQFLGLSLPALFFISLALTAALCLATLYGEADSFFLVCLPVILLEDRGVKYLMGGVLRNLAAITLISLSDVFAPLVLVLPLLLVFHPPTALYAALLKLWEEGGRYLPLAIISIPLLCILPFSRPSTIKLLNGLILNLTHPPRLQAWRISRPWAGYVVAKLGVVLALLPRLKRRDIIHVVYLLLPLFPLIYPGFAMRMLYLSFYPAIRLLKNHREEEGLGLMCAVYALGEGFEWQGWSQRGEEALEAFWTAVMLAGRWLA